METSEKLIKMICKEMDEIADGGKMTDEILTRLDKLSHTKKSILTADAMENAGYSEDGGYDGYSSRGQRRDSMGRYSRTGGSYGYSRNYGMPQYNSGYSNRGYSRADEREHAREQLEDMMHRSADETTRDAIRQALNQL